MQRRLIVNADDFGLSSGIDAGIAEAHEHGVLTSASLMVLQPHAEAAAAYARAHPRLGVGLHIDLWESVRRDGDWVRLYQRVPAEAEAVAAEIARQLGRFRALLGRDPDHLDTHQHVHRLEPVAAAVAAAGRALGVPVRGDGRVRYVGGFYGQSGLGAPYPEGITVERLLELIDALEPGCTELGCHPGHVGADEALGGTMYRAERNTELRTLCDARVRARLARGDVVATTYADLAAARS
jgi:predicted glycoside hydrolase/deacetylase ChbG (UPF0249 family)